MGSCGLKVCEGCHHAHMVAAQHRYHWGNFDEIKIDDPLMHKPVSFTELMQGLSVGLNAVGNDVRQGQIDGAKKQLAGFKARFGALQKVCSHCHETKREYFVDERVTAHFDAMDKALMRKPVDSEAIGRASMAIGQESCFGCHLVHVPAALSR